MSKLGDWLQRREAALTEWEHAKPGRSGRACYRAFSWLFIPLAIIVLIGLPLSGRELMWAVDGMEQYYPFFVYEGEWIRGIFSRLFGGEGFAVPLWEWCSGYGVDVPTTFDVFLDPLNLVSAITPGFLSEWVFQLLVLVRLYLAGLAFVYYCRVRGEGKTGTVFGALLYALCGSGLTVIQWTSGLHALILFPVVLAGAERILARGKPWVFIASLTLLAIVSYYFTCMACVLLVGYLALRVVMVERPNLTVKRFLFWVAVFAGLVVLCLMLAAFALTPAVMAVFGMERVTDQSVSVPLLYSLDYYLNLAGQFLSTSGVGSDTFVGFGGMAFFACLALFAGKGENRELKLVFVVLTVFLLLPIVGSFFNGMNYATNRWAWAYALCVAFIFARMTPALIALDARGKRVFIGGTAVYAVLFLVPAFRTEANVAGFAALLVGLIVLLTVSDERARRRMMGCALALTLAVNGFYFLAASEGGHGVLDVPLTTAYPKLTSNSVDSLALDANDASWWRYDAAQVATGSSSPMGRIRNNSVVLGVQGIDFYNSIYDSAIDAFHTELAVAGDDVNFSYLNLQGRSDLMALLGVKYYAYRNDGTDAIPFGFSAENEVAQRSIMGVDYRLLRSDIALPLGSTFDKAITREDYLALSPAKRQQALLQAVVLDETEGASANVPFVDADELTYEDASLSFTVAATDGARVEDDRIVVERPGATVTLQFEGVANASSYFYVTGFNYAGMKPSDLVSEEQKESMVWYHRANLMLQDLSYKEPLEYEVAVRSNACAAAGYIHNFLPSWHMYGGKDTWLVSLGSAAEPASAITLSFNAAGSYSYDDMQVIAQTHERTEGWSQARSSQTLENVSIQPNKLTATADFDEEQLVFLAIAKGAGWSAFLDGEPAELMRADTAFMALDVPAGEHAIELRYTTPGLAMGFALTGAGVLVLIVLVLVLRRRAGQATPQKMAPEMESEGTTS